MDRNLNSLGCKTMSSVVTSSIDAPILGSIVAYNDNSTKVAVSDGVRVVVRGCRPEDAATQGHKEEGDVSSIVVEPNVGVVTAMCWMEGMFGNVLCCGTDGGVVMVYAEPPGALGGCAAREYVLRRMLRYSTSTVTCVRRAPQSISNNEGPMMTVSYGDGSIRIFEGLVGKMHSRGGAQDGIEFLDSVDGVWEVHSVLSPIEKPNMGACVCFDWKACEDETAVLVAGYEGCCPQIYSYDVKHFTWTHRNELDSSNDATVSDIAWAPLLGRPYDIVAVAHGTCVTLWSISGPADELDMHIIAKLEHDVHVWQVGWNMTGNWLAASTEDNTVCLWRPDLAGEWLLLNVIQGLNKL